MTTSTRFTDEKAPCGRTVGGDRVRDQDEDGFVVDDQELRDLLRRLGLPAGGALGVHRAHETEARHDAARERGEQYHDGSGHVRVVDHHGKLRSDEHSSMHEA